MEKTTTHSSLIVEDLPVINPVMEVEDNVAETSSVSMRSQFGSDSWGESAVPRSKRGKRYKVYAIYGIVGILSFILFLYFSFPMNVVKEVAISKLNESFIQNKIPIRVSIAGLKMKFPLGIQLENMEISNINDSSAGIKIGRAFAGVSLLPVLWGNLEAEALVTQTGGNLVVKYNNKISSLIKMANSRNLKLPSGKIDVDFRNFEISSFVANALAYVRSGNDPQLAFIMPLLRLNVSGALQGYAKLVLPEVSDSLEKMTADTDVSVKKAVFKLDDETLGIDAQEFSAARLKIKLAKKSVEILPDTKFEAKDIALNLAGRMNVSDNMGVNDVNLKIGLGLKGKIESNFSSVFISLLKCDFSKFANGRLEAELTGTFGALTCK